MLSTRAFGRVGDFEALICFLCVVVSSIEDRTEESSLNAALVQHDGVLLVVARVASDGDDGVTPRAELFEVQEVHAARDDQGLLRVVQDMSQSIHSELVVAGINTHGLLSHGGLIGVPWRLVVIWEGNDACAHAQDHRRMDLTMSVGIAACSL